MLHQWANNAKSTLASGISGGATSFTVATGEGAKFPALTGSNYFYVTLATAGTEATREVVKVTARSGDVFTCVATANAYNSADKVELRITKSLLDLLMDTESPQTIAAGATKTFGDGDLKSASLYLTGQSASPSDPTSTDLKQFTKLITSIAPIPLPFLRDGLGATSRVPEWLSQMASWPPHGSWHLSEYDLNGVFRGYGANALVSTSGTKSSRAMTTGSFRGEVMPLLVTATAASTNAGTYFSQDANISLANVKAFWRGNAAGRGGFIVSMLFDFDTIASATGRFFAGLTNSATAAYITSADPAAGDQAIGLGFLDADNSLYIIGADGTNLGKVPLTTTRDRATATGRMYWLLMMAAPNNSGIWIRVVEFTSSSYAGTELFNENVTAGATINGATARIPTNTSLMRQMIGLSTGTGSVAQKMALVTGLAWTPR